MIPDRHVSPATPHRLRVLIADDERDEVATLAALLMDEGHQVREVYRGDTVLDQVRDFSPHVALLDIGMPGMNGYVIAKRLHEEYGEHCPVLIAQGRRDEVIPVRHGERIYQLANSPKWQVWLDGAGHNDVMLVASREFIAAIQSFAQELRSGSRAAAAN